MSTKINSTAAIARNALLSMLLTIVISVTATAGTPQLIGYQALLSDSAGNPLNQTVNVVFRIWSDSTGGIAVWTEAHNSTQIIDGKLSVLLGSSTPLDNALFGDTSLFLGIQIGGDSELSPRSRLATVPFAYRIGTISGASGGDVSGAIIISPDPAKALGDALIVKNSSNDTVLTTTVNVGGVEIALFDPVDSKDGLAVSPVPRVELTTGGIIMFDSTGVDTTMVLSSDGDISATGQIIVGPGSSGDPFSTVFGLNNSATGDTATISGGSLNTAGGNQSTVGGGKQNTASGYFSTVSGGWSNSASGYISSVSGGTGNSASGANSGVGGGFNNIASGNYSWIGGGFSNKATGSQSTIAGGSADSANGAFSGVASGQFNNAGNSSVDTGAFVGGGINNHSGEKYATVGGGRSNVAADSAGTVSGGTLNAANGFASTISGGYSNYTNDISSVVGGGYDNQASGNYSTVSGGYSNLTFGRASTIPGGYGNYAAGRNSIAAGYRAYAAHHGSIVIVADSSTTTFDTTSSGGAEQMVLRATGYFYLTNSGGEASIPVGRFLNTSTGAYLTTGGTWTNLSDKNYKENFDSIDEKQLLEGLSELEIKKWNYKAEGEEIKHIGPVSQDFFEKFHLGQDDKSISTVDASGVALAAIQALYKQNQELKRELEELRKKIDEPNR